MRRLLFGCHISVTNFIFGGRSGYSLGKYKWHLKKPPSLQKRIDYVRGLIFYVFAYYKVSGGPIISTSHLYMSLSSMSPAEKPSTGFLFNSGTERGSLALAGDSLSRLGKFLVLLNK